FRSLLKTYQVIHICGAGNIDETVQYQGYAQFEYVNKELTHLFAITDFVISRAGANAIFELLALQKPMLLIPLSLGASRGDQIENASSFAKKGIAHVLKQEEMTAETLLEAIKGLTKSEQDMRKQMEQYNSRASRDHVIKLIKQIAK